MKKFFLYFILVALLLSCDLFNNTKETDDSDKKETESNKTIDSDGDGYTDYEEYNDFLFSPDVNALKFNPFVADTPRISYTINSLPKITIHTTYNSEKSESISTEWSTQEQNSMTTSNTTASATSAAHSAGITVGVSYETGIDGGTTYSAEANYQYTHTNESSSSFTQDNTKTRTKAYTMAKSISSTEGYSLTGGDIKVDVTIKNTGNISFTLKSITLNATLFQTGITGVLQTIPINNLKYDGDLPETVLAPGQTMSGIFIANLSSANEAMEIISRQNSINIKIGQYNIVDESGRAFAHDDTKISAKTFSLAIDYGVEGDYAQEKYRISDASEHKDLYSILTKLLRIDGVEESETNIGTRKTKGLTKVRNHDRNPKTGGWIIIHSENTSNNLFKHKIYTDKESYSLRDIKPVRGDILMIVYVEDKDGDGLLAREEFVYGTDDNKTDTDGDGTSDFDEIKNGTNPLGEVIDFTKIELLPPPIIQFKPESKISHKSVDNKVVQFSDLTWERKEDYDNVYVVRSYSNSPISLNKGSDYTGYVGKILPGYKDGDEVTLLAILGNSIDGYIDENIKYSSRYYYTLVTYDNITRLYASSKPYMLYSDLKIESKINGFMIKNTSENSNHCEYLNYFRVTAIHNNEIHTFSDRRYDEWIVDEGKNEVHHDVSGWGTSWLVIPSATLHGYNENSDVIRFDFEVKESDENPVNWYAGANDICMNKFVNVKFSRILEYYNDHNKVRTDLQEYDRESLHKADMFDFVFNNEAFVFYYYEFKKD